MESKRRIDLEPTDIKVSSLYRRKLPILIRLKLWINDVLR